MNDHFSYFGVVEYQDQLYVDDIGNCNLSCGDDIGNVFYLIIRTNDVGQTLVLEFGPIVENQEFKDYTTCSCRYRKFSFDVGKIKKEIKSFINRKGTIISYAQQVEEIDEIKYKFFNIYQEFFKMIGVEL